MMFSFRMDADTEEVHVSSVAPPVDDTQIMHLSTTPASWHRYYVTEPPPFGRGDAGPFNTLAAAFDYMRSRGYVLNEDVVRERLIEAGEA